MGCFEGVRFKWGEDADCIAEAQYENQDDRAISRRNTKKLVDDFLKTVSNN